jgi:hypothetical protein
MLTRISSIVGALALGGLLVASTYGAPATEPHAPAHHARLSSQVTSAQPDRFVAPVPHQYRADGLRMGLHCETASMAMP